MSETFGFNNVAEGQKQPLVQKVFSDVAQSYDLMNDLMSFMLHRLWKRIFMSDVYAPGNNLLDLAGGTGDIGHRFLQMGGDSAVICDLNPEMLKAGRDKAIDSGYFSTRANYMCANMDFLPFEESTFSYVTVAFGIRNVTNISASLAEAYRVLKPCGRFLCLEFNSDLDEEDIISKIYEFYSFHVIPYVAMRVVGDDAPYRYLVESIRRFMSRPEFIGMLGNAGFSNVSCKPLTSSVVSIYSAYKI